jgi:hypothetical protein
MNGTPSFNLDPAFEILKILGASKACQLGLLLYIQKNAKNIGQQNFSLNFTSMLHKAAHNFLSCWAAHRNIIKCNQR